MEAINFFLQQDSAAQKQYEALRMYFVEEQKAAVVAPKFGYTYRAFTSLISDFKKNIKAGNYKELFFVRKQAGRHKKTNSNKVKDIAITLRKKNFSVEDIKISLDAHGSNISESTIYLMLKNDGFAKLPKQETVK